MKDLFFDLADHAVARLTGREVLLANFAGELTDFVRFNHARVRQPLTVRQAHLRLSLIDGQRRDNLTLTLSGETVADRAAVTQAIETLRRELANLPDDPYLLYSTAAAESERHTSGRLPAAAEAIDTVVQAAAGTDLVGLLASGPIYRGFASSLGTRHWHAMDAFLLDWSLYHSTDKAVKSAWAGSHWDAAELQQRMDAARTQLAHLAQPPRTLAPGEVRAYLSPAAVDELASMLSWGGVSGKAQRTKQSCLQRLVDGEAQLSPLVTVREDAAGGLAPAFDESGFTRPASVTLIEGGRHAGSMISPRTAREYGIEANGADEGEGLQSLAMASGTLPESEALAALDTGLWIGNLHYLNFSDRAHGRITGLTRFATFWVERGKIVAPVNVMRFDDTLYRVLGSQLEALTSAPEWNLNSGTYGERSVQTSRVPGALLSSFALTL
ncbi:MAG: metallopeptidase TldD-related protein [Burkholderiaceae bacterium]|jgi:predicted Zn-dependent protease|nr:metallopeptidase TldD-related protein [Burkholderiaceae bacterium]